MPHPRAFLPHLCLIFSAFFLFFPTLAGAQAVDAPLTINLGQDLLSSQRLFQLVALITILSLAPSILMMVTSFTRIVIVFSFLRSALGLQNSPPNTILISLAIFLTAFVMGPTLERAYTDGLSPYLNQQIDETTAFTRTIEPFKSFMMANVNEGDLQLFVDMLPEEEQKQIQNVIEEDGQTSLVGMPLRALIPAFIISELRRAFEIGFLLFMPFLVIDLTVASILMSMGMMMLPPVIVSLPFKIIFFVLVDGWHLLAASLVESFNTTS